MKWVFPAGTPQHVRDRMREIGVPACCTEAQHARWQLLVEKFLAGGLWIIRDNPDGTQSHEVIC